MSEIRKQVDPELAAIRAAGRMVDGPARSELESARFNLFVALEGRDLPLATRWTRTLRIAIEAAELGAAKPAAIDALGAIENAIAAGKSWCAACGRPARHRIAIDGELRWTCGTSACATGADGCSAQPDAGEPPPMPERGPAPVSLVPWHRNETMTRDGWRNSAMGKAGDKPGDRVVVISPKPLLGDEHDAAPDLAAIVHRVNNFDAALDAAEWWKARAEELERASVPLRATTEDAGEIAGVQHERAIE